ncbi:MAG: hypothetical protein IK080_04045 [Clostridia bacterium]|nr:hypothetical protein [Clostridia bacterium]
MQQLKRISCVLLAILLLLPLSAAAAEDVPPLESLDTSAVDGKLTAYLGVPTYFVVYPEPLEAESRFDVRNAVITCSEEGIVEAVPEKVEAYRFGSVNITGLKLGSTVVTVTEPESGVSCAVKVTVVPAFGYRLRRFVDFLNYLPYFIFMRLASIFYR